MNQYDCHVRMRNAPGQVKMITVDASSKEDAIQGLLQQGYVVVSVKQAGGYSGNIFQNMLSSVQVNAKAGMGKGGSLPFFRNVSLRELIFFAIQLATLLKAGVTLLRALEIVRKGIKNPFFQEVLTSIHKRISGGASLNAALKEHPSVFPWVWINLIEVGEATGKLPECLEEIAHYQESAARIQSKVITAFTYPSILLFAVTAALAFLLIFIVPKFASIFLQQGMQLPTITKVVIGLSDVLRTQALLVGLGVVLSVVGIFFLRKLPGFRLTMDMFKLNVPIFGTLLVQIAAIRFSRSLGTLLKSGVQILQSLEIAGRLVDNDFLELRIKEVATSVRSGQGLGIQLENKKIFPVFMTQLLTIGEETGELEKFLTLIADYYEDSVDTFLSRLTTMLEPLMLLIMGVVIGTVVISMFLPIIQLSTGGGMGG